MKIDLESILIAQIVFALLIERATAFLGIDLVADEE